MNFSQKNILFIGPIFHDYHNLILSEFKSLGANAIFFPEREYTIKFKIINNIFFNKMNLFQEKHYDKILELIQKSNIEFDILFVIRGYFLTPNFIQKLKLIFPNIKTILYQWDALRDNNYKSLIAIFDRTLTFDFSDSQELNIPYIPLFYTQDIDELRHSICTIKFDLFFMCWYTKERYSSLIYLIRYCVKNQIKIKVFIYIPFSSYLKELIKGNVINFKMVSFFPLKRKQYIQFLASSIAIVDFQKMNQSGLAIRIIEAIGAGKKILSNTKEIEREPFFNNNRINYIDPNNIIINKSFFIFNPIDTNYENIIQQYSLRSWLIRCFNFM